MRFGEIMDIYIGCNELYGVKMCMRNYYSNKVQRQLVNKRVSNLVGSTTLACITSNKQGITFSPIQFDGTVIAEDLSYL